MLSSAASNSSVALVRSEPVIPNPGEGNFLIEGEDDFLILDEDGFVIESNGG